MHRPEPLLSRTAAQAALADIGNHVPGPVEPDHLHRAGSPTCCTDHKKWRAFAAVVEDIRERVAIEHQDSTDAEYQHALVDAVLADPLGREMLALESACARRVLERSERRGRHDSLAEHRERQRDHLGEAAGRGEYTSSLDDLQSAVDELSGSTRAKKARKAGNVSLARKLEQQARDAKSTKRKSVRTHRAG